LLGLGTAAVGAYLGIFAWLNDGARAGLKLILTTLLFGAGFAAGGIALRFAAAAHARNDPRRWWIQLLAILLAYVSFGLAAWTTSLLDRLDRG
jgi:hypothetical protein